MKIHQLSAEEAIASVQSTARGLSPVEAERRLREHGSNVVQEFARESPWLRFVRELVQFFSLILWAAAGLAFLAEWSAPGPGHGQSRLRHRGGDPGERPVLLLAGVSGRTDPGRVAKTAAAESEAHARRQRHPGSRGASRARATSSCWSRATTSLPIAGWSRRSTFGSTTLQSRASLLPLVRDAGASDADEPIRGKNILLAGTSIVSGQAQAVVFATGMHTEFGKIARLTQTAGAAVSPLRQQLARLSRFIAVLAILIGLLFFAIGWLTGIPFWKDFIFAIGIIVAMVPEGLLPTLTLSLVLATQRMARRSVLIRYLPSVEALGSTTVICTDKTGTLTQNRMTVRQLFLGGATYSPAAIEPGCALAQRYRGFFLTAQLCHDLRETGERSGQAFLGDPMEVALVEMARRILSAPSSLSPAGRDPLRRRPHAAVHRARDAGGSHAVLQGRGRIRSAAVQPDSAGWRHTSARSRAAGADPRSPRNNGRAGPAGPRVCLPPGWPSMQARAPGTGSGVRRAGRPGRPAPARGAGSAVAGAARRESG